jgi:hypothetical protein
MRGHWTEWPHFGGAPRAFNVVSLLSASALEA